MPRLEFVTAIYALNKMAKDPDKDAETRLANIVDVFDKVLKEAEKN
ncbi:hypothetical protein AGMMS49975_03000 [Clostridia bacterium]|nr:hypothetical protein AGMMS49975_03000 [Clostridia bacterium]